MNLHEVRNSFESRVADIERETGYLLGKLALVIRAQGIAVEIGDERPGSTEFQAGNFQQTVTAFPASEPSPSSPHETSEPVEQPASYSNVAQFTPAAIAGETTEEVAGDAASAEAEAETITAADEELAEDTVAEDATEDQVEAAGEIEEPEQHAEEPPTDIVPTMPEAEQPEAEAESAQEAEARTSEAADCDGEPADDAITGLRKKLAAAAAEGTREGASQMLEEMSSQADVDVEEVVLETWQPMAEAGSAANTADSDAQSGDALVSLRKKLASAASDDSSKSPFLTLGKFLNRAK